MLSVSVVKSDVYSAEIELKDDSLSADVAKMIASLYIMNVLVSLFIDVAIDPRPAKLVVKNNTLCTEFDKVYYVYKGDTIEYHLCGRVHNTYTVTAEGEYMVVRRKLSIVNPDPYEFTLYTKEGVVHREDGPAFVRGYYSAWIENGRYHRVGAPAIVFYGLPQWYVDGQPASGSN